MWFGVIEDNLKVRLEFVPSVRDFHEARNLVQGFMDQTQVNIVEGQG